MSELPDLPVVEEAEPLQPFEILVPDDLSTTTQTNAANISVRLEALHEAKSGMPLRVVIVTTDLHSARAWANFRKLIPDEVASDIKILEYKGAPPLAKVGSQRKIHGLIYMFSEYLKRLYMVSKEDYSTRK